MNLNGPSRKYRGLAVDPIDNQTPLYWNAHPDGYPVRKGDAPDLIPRNGAFESGVIPFVRSQVFKIPDQIEEYTKVLDWIANGMGTVRFEERVPAKDHDGVWHVWLTWIDYRGYVQPPNR